MRVRRKKKCVVHDDPAEKALTGTCTGTPTSTSSSERDERHQNSNGSNVSLYGGNESSIPAVLVNDDLHFSTAELLESSDVLVSSSGNKNNQSSFNCKESDVDHGISISTRCSSSANMNANTCHVNPTTEARTQTNFHTAPRNNFSPLGFCICNGNLGEDISDAFRSFRAMISPAENEEKRESRQQVKVLVEVKNSSNNSNEELKSLSSASAKSIKTVTTISSSSSYDTSIASSLYRRSIYQPSLYMKATDLVGTPEQYNSDLQESPDLYHTLHVESATDDGGVHMYRPAPNKYLDDTKSELFIALDSSLDTPSPALHAIKLAFEQESYKFISSATTQWVPQNSRRIAALDGNGEGLNLNLDELLEQATTMSSADSSPLSLSPQAIKYLLKETILWTISSPQRPIAIRSLGIIPMSPTDLYDLLWDSSRTEEYNPFSCGRKDLWVIDNDENDDDSDISDDDGGVAMKVVRGETSVMRKTLPFITFFHGKKSRSSTEQGQSQKEKHMITTRTAKLVDIDGQVIDAKSFIGEIKMGTNLMVGIQGHPDLCLFMSAMDAGKSPLPLMISKRIGLASSTNFINGLREAAKRTRTAN